MYTNSTQPPVQPQFYNAAYPPYGVLRETQIKGVKRLSRMAGLCVIAFIILQNAFGLLLAEPTINDLYFNSEGFKGIFEMTYYVVSMFLPFFAAFVLMHDDEQQAVLGIFDKPTSKPAALCGVLAGLFFCAVGNYIAAFLTQWIDDAGLYSDGGVPEASATVVGLLFDILTVGLLPPLLEEFALRAVVMQPARKYGDLYAILTTALVFGLMHGNAAQIPFAFIVGAAIGFAVVSTGSIWVGVLIHMINNLYSLFLSYLVELRPTLAETIGMLETSVVLVFGFIGLVLLLTVCRHNKLQKAADGVLTGGEKTKAFLLTVPMMIAVILLVIETIRLLFLNHG